MKFLAYFAGVAFVLFSTTAFAQTYKPFRVAVGVGNTPPAWILPGYLLYLEPSWRIHDNFAIGLQLETMTAFNADLALLGSYSLNGQYYFLNGVFRYFGGIGLGIYTPNRGLLASCTCEDETKGTVLGFYPRLGFDYKHMSITLDYNVVQTVKGIRPHYNMSTMNPSPEYYDARASYLSLKVGLLIGGGKKPAFK